MVLDYLMLYPPYSVNGVRVSSWRGSVSTHPSEVLTEIEFLTGKCNIFVNYHLEKYDDIDLFLKGI